MSTILKGPTYYTADETHANAKLAISKGIVSVSEQEATNTYPNSYHLIPGMIDMHVHGSMGADVMDGTFEALQTIADSLLAQGTTAFLATTMSADADKIEQVLKNVANFSAQQTVGAKVLGVHLEGPFLAPEYVGAQRKECIIAPNIRLLKHWQEASNHIIKMVTIAPEQQNAIEFIEYCQAHNIIASFGHSAANYQQTIDGIDAGITHATHLFNAMRGIHHRKPGAVTAILLRDEVYAELICDNKHLSPAIIDLSYRQKTADKLILVTDATRAQCMTNGEYELGGQKIILNDKSVRLTDGTLAGSVLTLPEAIVHTLAATRCSLNDIVKMTSANPAKQLGIAPLGHVLFSEAFKLIDTYLP